MIGKVIYFERKEMWHERITDIKSTRFNNVWKKKNKNTQIRLYTIKFGLYLVLIFCLFIREQLTANYDAYPADIIKKSKKACMLISMYLYYWIAEQSFIIALYRAKLRMDQANMILIV